MQQVATRRLAVLVGTTLLAGAAVLGACGDDGDSAGDPALFCERLDRLTRNDPFLAFGETADAGDIEVAFGALVDRAGELLDVAPPEARAAARDYADAVEALDSLLAGAAYSPTEVDARAYRNEQVAYAEAAQRLERYLDAEC
jgi:hypothetical protein